MFHHGLKVHRTLRLLALCAAPTLLLACAGESEEPFEPALQGAEPAPLGEPGGAPMFQCAINGYSVLGPDFNHDGYADLAVGVPYEDLAAGADQGAVAVMYGSAGGVSNADQLLHREQPGVEDVAGDVDLFGYSIAYGDFNGDCYTDLAVGVPYDDVGNVTNAGSVHVFYGSALGLSTSTDEVWTQFRLGQGLGWDARFGLTLAVGDFDGDAYDDLVVGAPYETIGVLQDAGNVFVVHGSGNGLDSSRSQVWTQDSPGIQGTAAAYELFGSALATGDFNGDGRDDLAIGVPNETVNGASQAGSVHIVYGTVNGLDAASNQLLNEGAAGIPGVPELNDFFGFALAAGNFDDDDYDDLVIGVPGQEVSGHPAAGKITAIRGSVLGLSPATSKVWTQDTGAIDGTAETGDFFGYSLVAADFNGLGYDDVAVGVPHEGVNGHSNAGAVNLIAGSASGLTDLGHSYWRQGIGSIVDTAEDEDQFGRALAAGDYNGDHIFDLAVGVPYEDLGVTDMGAVSVIYGPVTGLASNQIWSQDSAGIEDVGEMGDQLGLGL